MPQYNQMSGAVIILAVILVVGIIFMLGKCKLDCSSNREGYIRSGLGNCCKGMERTEVDYAFKHPGYFKRNPHYRADPANEHQPLNFGPIDFYRDTRRLNENDGVLFQQYRNNWKGIGRDIMNMANDEKNRFDLLDIGAYSDREQMDNLGNPRFGPGDFINTEQRFNRPNPYYNSIYWDKDELQSKIGN